MSNLIRYIIQEDPEKEMRKKTWEKPTYSSIVAPREEIEASKKRSQNLLESALSSYNTKQTPTPWAKKQSNNLLERMSMTTPSAPKRLENNTPNLNRSAAGDIALEGIKGFGEGIEQGFLRMANGMSMNNLKKWSDNIFDGAYTRQEQNFENKLKSQNLGTPLKVANAAIDIGSPAKIYKKAYKKMGQQYLEEPIKKYIKDPLKTIFRSK